MFSSPASLRHRAGAGDLLFGLGEGAGDEFLEVGFDLFEVGFGSGHFEEDIASGVWDNSTEEHVVGGGDFVTRHHGADHIGAGDGDDGELLFAVGFFFGSNFGFAFELGFPAGEIGFNSASLSLAEVVEFEEGAFFFTVVESGFDHGGGRGFDP